MDFTKKLVEKASGERLIVYSGGAKGVDTISEKTAIETGSAVVSFIADSLSAKIKRKDVLQNIMEGKLLLFSDVKPDSGFTAARAMNRNKLIYAAAYGAFVISADYNKGGTWSGANENIRNDWTKEFVWNHKEYDGNIKLEDKQEYICNEDEKHEKGDEKDIYNIVSNYIIEQLGSEINTMEAAKKFNVAKGQMSVWLKRLCTDGRLIYKDGTYLKNKD